MPTSHCHLPCLADDGRRAIGVAMRLCPESSLDSQDDVTALRDWAASAWDYLAMGNYPFPRCEQPCERPRHGARSLSSSCVTA